ncbi:putative TetR family transcriptional regulator [Nocardia brasiliensis NBRC 14402]|uniref:TetR/AcrR family transcriptional regulator n=1 Tax=Nocardia brasiliensis TaxID=37326 RepID=UPI0002DC54AC|nr:TetR/AcrR family transcriptional regulator [Nocardia brasiliensis]ASF13282.1 TetR/AcrR family transcriptional regulator [Nocardia brasiliensis]GAJ80462.1 putative TetR family transcriptional regulator [Nocardia brasiliensis NBRC 14402]SUB10942.1 DNA-binding transcriptional repressor AcrR [Nocardia brasiliensis]
MSGWLADGRAELASERILDAVRALFIEKGVSGIGMAEVAEAAGCSRATLYRYFENRQALYVAFAGREARQVVERVWRDPARPAATDPADRLLDGLTALLAEVRKTPHLAVWFAADNAGIVAQLSNSSAVLDALAADFVSGFRPGLPAKAAQRVGQWVIRAMVSLLTLPGDGEDEERTMLRTFVLPFLLDERTVVE